MQAVLKYEKGGKRYGGRTELMRSLGVEGDSKRLSDAYGSITRFIRDHNISLDTLIDFGENSGKRLNRQKYLDSLAKLHNPDQKVFTPSFGYLPSDEKERIIRKVISFNKKRLMNGIDAIQFLKILGFRGTDSQLRDFKSTVDKYIKKKGLN
jgi:hypothetical protein